MKEALYKDSQDPHFKSVFLNIYNCMYKTFLANQVTGYITL